MRVLSLTLVLSSLLLSKTIWAQDSLGHLNSQPIKTIRTIDKNGVVVEHYNEDSPSVPHSGQTDSVVPDSWIVTFKQDSVTQFMQSEVASIQGPSQAGSSAKSSTANLKQRLGSYELSLMQQQSDFVAEAMAEGLVRFSGRHFTKSINAMVVYASENDVAAIQSLNGVNSVTPNRIYSPLLTRSTRAIKADQVWQQKDENDNNITGLGVKIAILDTGIDYTHESLGGCFGEGCKVAGGYDFVHDDADPIEDEEYYRFLGHGTHVAGIAAADGQVRGVAYEADLYAYKVCGIDNCPTDLILAGLEMAADPDGDPTTDDGADVINLSLGSRFGNPDDPVPTLINALVEQGIVVVVAAGNDAGLANIGGIASARDAITVAASNYDSTGMAIFSSRGPVKGVDFMKPDISAPGDSIESSCVIENSINSICYLSGTSMAAPHVAGVAALLIQSNKAASPFSIKSYMLSTSSPFEGIDPAEQGAGLVDALRASKADISFVESILYFGDLGLDFETFSLAEMTIANDSTNDKELTISIEGAPIAGLQFDLISEREVSLKPKDITKLELSITLDIEHFRPEHLETLTASQSIVISDSNTDYSIPIIKSLFAPIEINAVNQEGWLSRITLMNQSRGNIYYSGAMESPFYLPVGDYAVVATLEDWENAKVLFIEDINISETEQIELDFDQAIHQLRIDDLIDSSGEPIDKSKINRIYEFEYTYKPTKYFDYTSSSAYRPPFDLLNKPVLLSNVSDNFDIRLVGLFVPELKSEKANLNYYVLNEKFSGLSGGKTYSVDASHMQKQSITFENKLLMDSAEFPPTLFIGRLATPDGFSSRYPRTNSGFGLIGKGAGFSPFYPNGEIDSTNVKVQVFSTNREDQTNYDLGLLRMTMSPKEGSRTISVFENISFSANNKINVWERYKPSIGLNINRVRLSLNTGDYIFDGSTSTPFISASLEEQQFSSELSLVNPFNSYIDVSPPPTYKIYCDGDEIGSGQRSGIHSFEFCEEYQVDFQYTNSLLDATYRSNSSVVLKRDYSVADGIIVAPQLQQIYLTNNIEQLESKVDSEGTRLNLVVLNDSEVQVMLELKIDKDWISLPIDSIAHSDSETRYYTDLPVPERARDGFLRIHLVDEKENSVTHVISGAFFIGKVQSGILTDDFDHDGIPDYKDMDDDNDGIDDLDDVLVLDALHDDDSEVLDTDNDGVGNNADTDDDNDGVEDSEDDFPFDASESVDTDGDGIGNNKDRDDDGDGIVDFRDCAPLDTHVARVCADFDFDGDGQADVAVRRPSTSFQYIKNSSDGQIQRHVFGKRATDIPVAGDFDGDGITDIAVRRPSNRTWYIKNSSGSNRGSEKGDGIQRHKFGLQAEDIPVPADYDGDGITDIAVRRPSTGLWYIKRSSDNEIERHRFFTDDNDMPVKGDFDGDGIDDVAYASMSAQKWFIRHSSDASVHEVEFELSVGDTPVTGEFDGDGKTDIAIRRPSQKSWSILNSESNERTVIKFGKQAEDIPILADYDGDGITDISVRRPSEFMQFILRSSDGEIDRVRFGLRETDIPLAAPIGIKMDMLN